MSDYNIPEQFFKDNPIREMGVGTILMFNMDTLFSDERKAVVKEAEEKVFPESRREEILADAELTERASSAEEVINRMRKGDVANVDAVCSKALAIEDEIMPEVIRRLKRSSHDVFIESAVLTLSRAKECYIDQIVREFDEIRSPYAISASCILLAYRNRFDSLPIIMKAFQRLNRLTDEHDRSCSDGALYAIYSLTGHFK